MSAPADQLAAGALCTLREVLRFAPGYELGAEPQEEERLQWLIGEQSRDWKRTGRLFLPLGTEEEPVTRSYEISSYECEERVLLIDDASSIAAVEFFDQAGVSLQAIDSTSWVELPRNRDTDADPIEELEFPRYATTPALLRPNTVCRISGVFGFPTIPQDVRGAVARLVIYRYLTDVAGGGDETTTRLAELATQGGTSPNAGRAAALEIMADYRRSNIA